MKDPSTRTSKFLSLVLRHRPQMIGISLDDAGWVPVAELLKACAAHGVVLTEQQLRDVVENNDKKRFALSDDGSMIRASQGHSVNVELGYEPAVPPESLYHGTVEKFVSSIERNGLIKGKRHHVHLSPDIATATKVGGRRGKPVVLEIKAGEMHRAGIEFFVSANGVWLTEQVPPGYIVRQQ
ncbi:MAG TPA: RNA 2'-phosphotransferase [Blastocatellia bacterium]|nr:RNA 2'-phosphotransferase [Blastocatellia bacterium]